MAVGGKPNVEYVLESLIANLKTINTANGYWTDVRTVKMPNYQPLQDAMMAEEEPALLVWVAGEFPAEGRIGMPDRALDVWIYGVVTGENIQVQLLRLVASLRKCILYNRQLNYPGGTIPNTWGRGIDELSEEVSYEVESGEQSKAAGILFSKWRVLYAYPAPAG